MVEQKRQLMMQNLFGESEEDEKEGIASEPDEIASEQESNPRLSSASEEKNINEGLEASDQTERKGDTELDSEEEVLQHGNDIVYNENIRNQSSHDVDPTGYDGEESEDKEFDSDMDPENHLPAITRNNIDATETGSDGSKGHQPVDEEEEGLDDAEGSLRRSPQEEKVHEQIPDSADKLRGVFGDSDDEEEPTGPVAHSRMRSPGEEDDIYEKTIRPEDIIRDEDGHYESEEETDARHKEKPVGPPLTLEIPFAPPPAHPDKMNMIKVSNIFGIDQKRFDPNTFIDEDTFVTDESGSKKRIRLENNTVRWRTVRNKDGTTSYESNARFVRWSDGSLQLLIGNEVLDISVQDQRHDQAHLFLRHGKGILQSEGRLLRKMRFIPSSLTSNSHRLLTALVDSRHKKVYKVKNCVTNIDPEREKEEKEKALNQTIKANEILSRKREKVNKKYAQPAERGRQLSPGFLEEALDEEEEEEPDYDEPRHSTSRHQFEEEMEVEARAERRILNAKGGRDVHGRSSTPVKMRQQRPVDFSDSDKEGSAYESSDREEVEEVESPPRKRNVEEREYRREEPEMKEDENGEGTRGNDPSDEEEEEEDEEEDEEEEEAELEGGGGVRRKEMESDAEEPPPKRAAHRRMAVVYDSDED